MDPDLNDPDLPDEYLWIRIPDSVAYMSANLNFILAKIARIITCIVQILSTLWRYLSQAFDTFNLMIHYHAPFVGQCYRPFSLMIHNLPSFVGQCLFLPFSQLTRFY